MKMGRILVFVGLILVVALVVVFVFIDNPLRASPGLQGGVDIEHYNALKSQVEDLRKQGRDVSRLDQTIADIDYWIAQGKVSEANLRLLDLESDLNNFDNVPTPNRPAELVLPPAPAYDPAPETGGTVLFQDGFASPDALAAWQGSFLQQDPGNMATWVQKANALCLDMGAGGLSWVGLVDIAGESWDNYVYSVDIYPLGSLEVGAIVRYGNSSFYRFRFLSGEYKGVPTRLLERVDGDKVTVLAQAEGAGYATEQWYNVQVSVVGSQITVYLDGQPILQATDSGLTQGQVGVYGLSNGNACFDNVRVSSSR
jgi:hypothetical protein